jgi:hypothetical protein
MIPDLPPSEIVKFIIGDFEDAWDAVAGTPPKPQADGSNGLSRGNFMFSRQATTLLEVACRLCFSDPSGAAIKDFTDEIERRDRRYFTPLPGTCWSPQNPVEFHLPSRSTPPYADLLAALFDVIRNGQAHLYQQIRAQLSDSRDFAVCLTGAEHGLVLSRSLAGGRPAQHLRTRSIGGDLVMDVRPDVLFLDIRDALRGANLLARGLNLIYLERPRNAKSPHYKFTGADLEAGLRAGGHF